MEVLFCQQTPSFSILHSIIKIPPPITDIQPSKHSINSHIYTFTPSTTFYHLLLSLTPSVRIHFLDNSSKVFLVDYNTTVKDVVIMVLEKFAVNNMKVYTPYTPPIHSLYTPYTLPIHSLYTPYTPPIHPYTPPIQSLYNPYTPL